MFVGLNPSTADAEQDDPTIRRCIGFAKDWGYGALLMGNLFAFRATNPIDMAAADDPVGPDNNLWLTELAECADLIVVAWGAHTMASTRVQSVIETLGDVKCLGVTKHGHPRHPLYLPKTATPITFKEPK